MKPTRPKKKKQGRPATVYGGRTFQGWVAYYEAWGKRQPCTRTISAHYSAGRKAGLTDDEIIEAQKRLWRDNITKCSER